MATPVFVNESRNWVVTDINNYASRQDIIDYLERLYPTVYNARRRMNIQDYNVDVCVSNRDDRCTADMLPDTA